MTYLSHECRQKLINAGFPAEELKLGVAEEILRRLPEFILVGFGGPTKAFCKHYRDCRVRGKKILPTLTADTLANAAAAMYCYLANNGLLPTEA